MNTHSTHHSNKNQIQMKAVLKPWFIVVLFIATHSLNAQDLIILKNFTDTIKCKIIEDKVSYLTYIKTNSSDTTLHQISQTEIEYYIIKSKNNQTLSNDSMPQSISPANNEAKTNAKAPAYTSNSSKALFYHFNLGLGLGIDYGGIGLRFSYLPIKEISTFASFGYAFIGTGYNIGLSIKALPDKLICPYSGFMYGYNAFIKVTGVTNNIYDKIFYGPSFNLGFEIHFTSSSFFNFELILPFRSKAFNDEYNELKNNPMIEFKNEPSRLLFSIGLHSQF